MKIAIIGSGISGLSAAYFLHKSHDIKLYEKNPYLGGHTRTVKIEDRIPVDTGFIVFNHKNYPNLKALFEHLNIQTAPSNMSFGISVNSGKLEYGTRSLFNLFAQKRNLFNPNYFKMLKSIYFFFQNAHQFKEKDSSYTLGECLEELKLNEWCKKYFILPMGSAIWSSDIDKMMNFPASSFINFFDNHGLLSIADQPQWFTVVGGAATYVKKIIENFSSNIIQIPVKHVRREEKKVIVVDDNENEEVYDQVIFACHADEVLKIFSNISKKESDILSTFSYQENKMYLHSDTSFMPVRKSAWSSWNYLLDEKTKESELKVVLSYWMNLLQPLDTDTPIIVTLNPNKEPKHIYDTHTFTHPIFDKHAINSQKKIMDIQGINRVWYCGAYQKNGFHEDGIWSATRIAKELNVALPWI